MMKSYQFIKKSPAVFAFLVALMVAQCSAFAQVPGSVGGANAMTSEMVKLFGNNTAFTSKAEFLVLNKSRKEPDTLPMTFAALDGKLRMDIDMAQIKSASLPPSLIPSFRQMGMDQTVVIMRPDKKVTLSIFPRAKAYAEVPMTREETLAVDKNYKVQKAPLGKENVDGHACEKNKVILTDDKGTRDEATVWNATDLKDFPVQMQIPVDKDSTVVIKFRDVKLGRLDPGQFEAPAGLAKYSSAEALLQDIATKIQGGKGAVSSSPQAKP
jgi:hypothetical protein